jgi:HSP20 family protein
MSLVRFDPFREITRFSNVFGDSIANPENFGFLPAVDIRNGADHSLVIEADLPGVPKDGVSVRIENRTLTIKGERKRETTETEGKLHRTERAFGTFVRSFALSEAVDTTKVQADYKDGVLTVTLPRAEESKPRSIEVKVA